MSIVKLGKLSNVEALIALFNNAKTQGLGVLHYNQLHKLSNIEANILLLHNDYIDYLKGRVIKTRFPLDATEIDCTLYDRDNGEGSAERAIREYERVHYLERGTESLYIPESFGGSRCTIVKDFGYGNVYKFNVMGGQLSVYQLREVTSGLLQTFFRFEYNNRYLLNKIDGNINIDKDFFIINARKIISTYVNGLE